jgi:hypothetical protein
MADNNGTNGLGFMDLAMLSPVVIGGVIAGQNIITRMNPKSNVLDSLANMGRYPGTIPSAGPLMGDKVSNFATRALSGSAESILWAWQKALDNIPENFRGELDPSQFENPIGSMENLFRDKLKMLPLGIRNQFIKSFSRNKPIFSRTYSKVLSDIANTPIENPHQFAVNMAQEMLATQGVRSPNSIKSQLINPQAYNRLPSAIQGYAKEFLEKNKDFRIFHQTRSDLAATGHGSYRFTFADRGVSFNVPISSGGSVVLGKDLSSRYIASKFSVIDPGTGTVVAQDLLPEQYIIERFKGSYYGRLNELSGREKRGIGKQLTREVRERLTNIPLTSPESYSSQLRGYVNIRSQTTLFSSLDGKPVRATEAASIPEIEGGLGSKYFSGGISGTSKTRGALATYDVRQLYMGAESVPEARAPGQAVKRFGMRAWEPSLGKNLDAIQNKYLWSLPESHLNMFGVYGPSGDLLGSSNAFFMRTAFMQRQQTFGRLMGDGEIIVAKQMKAYGKGYREAEMRLESLATNVIKGLDTSGTMSVGKGEFIGNDPMGNPITAGRNLKILGQTIQDSNIILQTEEELPLRAQEKIFGLKGSMVFDEGSKIIGLAGKGVQAIADIDALKKGPHLHYQQMATRLWEAIEARKKRGMSSGINDPRNYFNSLTKTITEQNQGRYIHAQTVAELVKTARSEGLTKQELGEVFGAVPTVLGQNYKEDVGKYLDNPLTQRETRAFETGTAKGVIWATHGGPRSERFGYNRRATIEPRTIEMLGQGHLGPLGEELVSEFSSRLSGPGEQNVVSKELLKSLSSFAGGMPGRGDRRFEASSNFSSKAFAEFVEGGGGWITGAKNIYVPDIDAIKMQGGFRGKLYRTYQNLARGLSGLESGDITSEAFEKQYWEAAQNIQAEQAPFGKGVGGFYRGRINPNQKITGSRFLQLASKIGDETIQDPFGVGISDFWFNKMSAEMEGSPEELAELKEQWKTKGTVSGVAWRHPNIGPYSTVPVNIHRLATNTKEAVMVMPEIKIDGINISAVTGMAADFDGDFAGLMLLKGQTAEQASKYWDATSLRAYLEHAIRVQTIKPKAQSAVAEMNQFTLADLTKVALRKDEATKSFIGQLSTVLSEAKASVSASGNANKSTALSMLELMEQLPISAKHMAAGDIVGKTDQLRQSLEATKRAISSGTSSEIAENFRGLLGKNFGSDIEAALGQDMPVSERFAREAKSRLGVDMGSSVSGINLEETARTIAGSRDSFKSSGRLEEFRKMAGKSKISPSAAGIKDYVKSMARMTEGEGTMGMLSRLEMAASNISIADGKRALKYAKPIAIGAGIALGLAAMANTPQSLVGMRSSGDAASLYSKPVRHTSEASLRQGDTETSTSSLGSPSAPSHLMSPTAMIGSNRGYNVNARLYTKDSDNDPAGLAGAMKMIVGNVNNSTITVRDNLSTLNMDTILNKLF